MYRWLWRQVEHWLGERAFPLNSVERRQVIFKSVLREYTKILSLAVFAILAIWLQILRFLKQKLLNYPGFMRFLKF